MSSTPHSAPAGELNDTPICARCASDKAYQRLDGPYITGGFWYCPECDVVRSGSRVHVNITSAETEVAALSSGETPAEPTGIVSAVGRAIAQYQDDLDEGRLLDSINSIRQAASSSPTPGAASEDAARLDFLEQEATNDHPRALFRRNTPITRAAIDAARASREGGTV